MTDAIERLDAIIEQIMRREVDYFGADPDPWIFQSEGVRISGWETRGFMLPDSFEAIRAIAFVLKSLNHESNWGMNQSWAYPTLKIPALSDKVRFKIWGGVLDEAFCSAVKQKTKEALVQTNYYMLKCGMAPGGIVVQSQAQDTTLFVTKQARGAWQIRILYPLFEVGYGFSFAGSGLHFMYRCLEMLVYMPKYFVKGDWQAFSEVVGSLDQYRIAKCDAESVRREGISSELLQDFFENYADQVAKELFLGLELKQPWYLPTERWSLTDEPRASAPLCHDETASAIPENKVRQEMTNEALMKSLFPDDGAVLGILDRGKKKAKMSLDCGTLMELLTKLDEQDKEERLRYIGRVWGPEAEQYLRERHLAARSSTNNLSPEEEQYLWELQLERYLPKLEKNEEMVRAAIVKSLTEFSESMKRHSVLEEMRAKAKDPAQLNISITEALQKCDFCRGFKREGQRPHCDPAQRGLDEAVKHTSLCSVRLTEWPAR